MYHLYKYIKHEQMGGGGGDSEREMLLVPFILMPDVTAAA